MQTTAGRPHLNRNGRRRNEKMNTDLPNYRIYRPPLQSKDALNSSSAV